MSDVTDCRDPPQTVKDSRNKPDAVLQTGGKLKGTLQKCSLNRSMDMQNSAHLWGVGEHSLTRAAGTRWDASMKLMTSGSAIRMEASGPPLHFQYFLPEEDPPFLSWVEALFGMFFNPTAG